MKGRLDHIGLGRDGMGREETMAHFLARRRWEQSLAEGAEALAHKAYGAAIRAGEDLRLPTTRDLIDYGIALQKRKPGAPAPPLKRSRTGKDVAGDLAEDVGNVVGVGRGALNSAKGLADGAVFLARLRVGDRRAEAQVKHAGGRAIDYAAGALSDPEKVVDDINEVARRARIALDPRATPQALTLPDEVQRKFGVGMNQGELIFDAASAVVGGPLAKGFKGLERVSKTIPAERYLAAGYKPETLAYLDQPYPSTGMASHFVGRRYGLPKAFTDSTYNVLRPPGASRRQMYEEHYRVDDRFHGAKLPAEFAQHWSAKRLGLERYGPNGQVWYGSPAPLKARVGGAGAAMGSLAYDPSEEDGDW
jgi:hypothetical protein